MRTSIQSNGNMGGSSVAVWNPRRTQVSQLSQVVGGGARVDLLTAEMDSNTPFAQVIDVCGREPGQRLHGHREGYLVASLRLTCEGHMDPSTACCFHIERTAGRFWYG
mmetsp:Transcript_42237/g.95412  ORF Transcript_42237/g.95412 Transcript_42237/m.95412 type:complete len:108 (+) Transcript_42237:1176-1499(+)